MNLVVPLLHHPHLLIISCVANLASGDAPETIDQSTTDDDNVLLYYDKVLLSTTHFHSSHFLNYLYPTTFL